MRLAKTALWAATLLLLGGCTDKAADSAPAGTQAQPAATSAAAPALASAAAAAQPEPVGVEVPAPGQVLADIYGMKGDGSASYTIDNNALASFWYGYRFDLGGKQYYTGFANAGPEKYGKSEEETTPDPAVGVSISQATYVLDSTDGKPTWTLFHAQQWAGDFGSNEKADTLDQKRKPQSTETKDGHLLLALPTSSFGNGVTSAGFALFTFDPNKNELGGYEGWVYRGTVAAGEDNEASSDEEGLVPHVSSVGTLRFQPVPGEPLPAVQVALSGTAIAGPGRARMLDASDAVRYAYDQASGQYLPKNGG
ncbi:hypothetical protein [Xanthomonas translucens]|uniref:hypothetical protein n=1 Tax=Xanthomonas campestris pv. translucens TaxID=343 RepID=UPI000570D526|nr:hypothetical protein [Xanthomonas translucens]MBC3970964.1 hypothetical protein [Xanthomonas translucens pv. undulosa]MCT8281910.1 hypothetical protein [Xanthomonas translucens pv. undulosa]MCT8316601.1 hypothetical protein [Xanthomonas translucens pv. undulosa]QEN92345.1 hypothetical protein F0H33_02205 [Xanthomonas translucens pv. undulosa]QSQ41708.1 hypothetical protein ISN33_19705 [Xanthomonas translucens pv. translucens]